MYAQVGGVAERRKRIFLMAERGGTEAREILFDRFCKPEVWDRVQKKKGLRIV